MNLPSLWSLVFLFSITVSVVLSFHVKTSSRHKASWTRSTQVFANRNNQVSIPPDDTSVASRIDEATPFLQQVGRSYTDVDAWEKDIHKLHELLHLTRYHHSTIKKHIFNLPINKRTNDRHNHEDEQSLSSKCDYLLTNQSMERKHSQCLTAHVNIKSVARFKCLESAGQQHITMQTGRLGSLAHP